jgi:hypothetical protein
LPVNSKAKCRGCRQSDYVTEKREDDVYEKDSSLVGIESSSIDEQADETEKRLKKITKKSSSGKKSIGVAKSTEKTATLEFEEETITGKKPKHRYSRSFSDPYYIR